MADGPHSAAEMLRRINEPTHQVRNLFITFVLFCTYQLLLIGSTSDEDLLTAVRLPIPLLNVELPITGVYFIAPLLLLILHGNLLLQFILLARKYRHFDQSVSAIGSVGTQAMLRDGVDQFVFAQAMLGTHLQPWIRILLGTVLYLLVLVIPITLLLGFQVRFLPAHDVSMTAWHRGLVGIDIVASLSAFIAIRRTLTRRPSVQFIGALIVLAVSALVTSLFVAVIPGEIVETRFFRPAIHFVFGPDMYDTPSHFESQQDVPAARKELTRFRTNLFRRNLMLSGKTLVARAPSDALLASYNLRGRSVNRAWREQAAGLDLSGRDLRFANLRGARMPRANLRGANLSGANLSSSSLEEADLTGATLVGADLGGADLVRADLQYANLVAASLYQTKLTGADLMSADLALTHVIETELEGALLFETSFDGAQIVNSTLRGALADSASFKGAVIEDAILNAANFTRSQWGGAQVAGDGEDANVAHLTNWSGVSFLLPQLTEWNSIEKVLRRELPEVAGTQSYDALERYLKLLENAKGRMRTSIATLRHGNNLVVDDSTRRSAAEAGVTFFGQLQDLLPKEEINNRVILQFSRWRCNDADEAWAYRRRVLLDDDLDDDDYELAVSKYACDEED